MKALLAFLALVWSTTALASPVLVISLDGLRAVDARDGARMPVLARLRSEGMAASGVTPGWPSLTYPSHATLVTGVSPARHGIGGNEAFDPTGALHGGWMWYADAIRADTLWAAARRSGLASAAINWPVSVGAGVDWNLPQIWRNRDAGDANLLGGVETAGLAEALAPAVGAAYPLGSDPSCAADDLRARYAGALIAAHHPDLMLLHLECLDHSQHDFGPGSAEAHTAMAELDGIVGRLVVAVRAAIPGVTIVVVSDHGFAPVNTAINLHAAFRAAGLEGAGGNWRAYPWQMGGTAAIVLHDRANGTTRREVASLLARLAGQRRLGIAKVTRGGAGGTTRASFWIAFRPGFTSGGDASGPLVQRAQISGMHGYPPNEAAMSAVFIMAGPGVREGCKVGRIDMRSVAPAIARVLDVRLRDARQGGLGAMCRR